MNYLRNIFCLLILFIVLGIILINTDYVRSRVKEAFQEEFKKNTGFNLEVGNINFDFPRTVVLHNISLNDTPQGAFHAEKLTFTSPLLKLIFGDRKEISATIDLEGLKANNPTLAQIPTSLRTSVKWNANDKILEGMLYRLESTNSLISYSLEGKDENLDKSKKSKHLSPKGAYKIVLARPGEKFHKFACDLYKVKTVGFVLEDVKGTGRWDVVSDQGKFSLLAKDINYGFYSLSNFGIKIENNTATGQWKYKLSTDGMAIDPFKAAARGLFGFVEGVPQLKFDELNVEYGNNLILLKTPFQIQLEENQNFVIDQAYLSVNGKDIRLSGQTNLEDLDVKLNVSKQLFNFILPGEVSPLSGVLTGTFFFQGTLANLHGDAEFSVKTFSYTLPGEVSPITGDFSGTLSLQGTSDNFHGGAELNLKSFSYAFPGENSPRFDGLSGTISLLGKPENLHGSGEFKMNSFTYSIPGTSSPVTAAVSGSLSVEGALNNLRGGAELIAQNISIDHPLISKKSQFQLGLSATLLEDVIALKGALHDREDKLLDVEGYCPVQRGKGDIIVPSTTKEMAVHLSGKVDIVKYLRKAISSDLWLTGDVIANLDINGPFHAPQLKGNLKWERGSLEHWESGILFHSAQANFDLKNDKITLTSLQASDEVGGKVMAAGVIDLTPTLNFPFNANLSIDRSRLLNIDNTSVVLSGKGTFSGDIKGATVKGDFNADSVDIFVKEGSSSLGDQVDVIYLNQSPSEPAPTQLNQGADKWPISYDIHVRNKGSIAIYNKEFTSEWKGDLKIAGNNSQPLFSGDLRLKKGEYLFKGKKLKVVEGTISFAGDLKKKTTLYVVVEMEIDRIVVQIVLKGPIDNPSLAFRSTPPMSQREILSWIVFGRGARDITPYEGAELVQSLSDLKASGNGSDENLLSRLKDSLGLDRIDISGGDGGMNEEISLQVGKYILPEVFLGIKRSMNSDVNKIGIEASLIKDIKIEAEVGDHDAGAEFHLKWKHDY